MEPKLDLSDITIDNHHSGSESTDTITLSVYPWSNTTIAGGDYTVSPGYGAVPNVTITTGSNTSPYNIGAGTGINSPWYSNALSPKIRLDGEGADIEVNGWSLIDAIQKIEERLNILHPNDELEAEWEELRALGNQYRALEAKLKEQGQMWAKLKAMPPPEID